MLDSLFKIIINCSLAAAFGINLVIHMCGKEGLETINKVYAATLDGNITLIDLYLSLS
jgi:hypothetical protein